MRTITVTFLINVNHHVPTLPVFHDSLKVQQTKTLPGRGNDFRTIQWAEPLWWLKLITEHENPTVFLLFSTGFEILKPFWRESVKQLFYFLRLTPGPPLTTTEVFREPGTALPAAGNAQVCDERPPACGGILRRREPHRAGTAGRRFPPGSEPTGTDLLSLQPLSPLTHFGGFL